MVFIACGAAGFQIHILPRSKSPPDKGGDGIDTWDTFTTRS